MTDNTPLKSALDGATDRDTLQTDYTSFAAEVLAIRAKNARLRTALKRMLLEFDFMIEANMIQDTRNDVIFVEARAALNKEQPNEH